MPVIKSSYHSDMPDCSAGLGTDGQTRTAKVCYCVDLDPNRVSATGPLQIKSAAQSVGPNPLPQLGDFYQYGNEFNLGIVATKIGNVEINKGNCNRAKICVEYSALDNAGENGEPPEDPTFIPKEVNIDFISESVPGVSYRFNGFCDAQGNPIVEDDDTSGINSPVLTVGDVGPIRNSAGCPISRNCLEYTHVLRVRSYYYQWNCDWSLSFGKWNTAPVRIIEQDAFSILFDCTYPECTLQMLPAGKSLIEYEGRKFVCVDWNILYDPDGYVIKQLDAGTQAGLVAGVADVKKGEQFSSGGDSIGYDTIQPGDERLVHNKTGKRDLDVTEPILLNGEGVEWCVPNDAGIKPPIYLNYTKEDSKFDFNLLPICTPLA